MFLHAFSGCDTTSAFFNKGKEKILKFFSEDPELINRVQAFYRIGADPNNCDDLWHISLYIVSKMYIKKTIAPEKYNSIRLECFNKLNTSIDICKLPPTDLAVKEHAKRVYLQCQNWLSNKLDPTNWGWKLKDAVLIPTYTTKPLLPESFIKRFRCSCKTGCKKNRCSCKKLGLSCSIFCKICKGRDCENSENIMHIDDVDEEDTYDENDFVLLEPEVILDCTQEDTEDSEVMNETFDFSEPEILTDEDDESENNENDNTIEESSEEENNPVFECNTDEEDDIHINKRPRLF